jgi:cell division protein FtsA
VPGVGGRSARTVSAQVLASIIEPRLEEILDLALKEIERVVDPALLAGGVVLTGGCARMPELPALTERVLGLPCRVGLPEGLRGLNDLAFDPRLSASVGLLRYAAESARPQRSPLEMLDRFSRPFRQWIRANL